MPTRGILNVHPLSAHPGDTVTVTVLPNAGYAFDLPGASYTIRLQTTAQFNAGPVAYGSTRAYTYYPAAVLSVPDSYTVTVQLPAVPPGDYILDAVWSVEELYCTQPLQIAAAAGPSFTPMPIHPSGVIHPSLNVPPFHPAPSAVGNVVPITNTPFHPAPAAPTTPTPWDPSSSGPGGPLWGTPQGATPRSWPLFGPNTDPDGNGFIMMGTPSGHPTPEPVQYVFRHEGDILYALSDIHLQADPQTNSPGAFFQRYDSLIRFITWAAEDAKTAASRAGHLVLVGDLFDIWGLGKGINQIGAAALPDDETKIIERRLDLILSWGPNKTVLKALQDFLNAGPNHKITYVVGNHDSPIRYAANTAALYTAVKNAFNNHSRFHVVGESAYDTTYGVLFEHGHQSGSENYGINCFGKHMVENWVTPVAGDPRLSTLNGFNISMCASPVDYLLFILASSDALGVPLVDEILKGFFTTMAELPKADVVAFFSGILTLPTLLTGGLLQHVSQALSGNSPTTKAGLYLKYMPYLAVSGAGAWIESAIGVTEAPEMRAWADKRLSDPALSTYIAAHTHEEDFKSTYDNTGAGNFKIYANTNTWARKLRKRTTPAPTNASLADASFEEMQPGDADGQIYSFVRIGKETGSSMLPDPTRLHLVNQDRSRCPHSQIWYKVQLLRWLL